MRRMNGLENTVQDIRYSLRVLAKSPGFTAVALLTLALASALTRRFWHSERTDIRPLNVPRAESLYGSAYGDGAGWQSYPNYVDLRDRNRSFEALAAFNFAFVGLDTGKERPLLRGMQPAATTLTCSGFNPISAASSTLPMNAGPTALLTSCSATPTGRATFTMTGA